MSDENKQYYVCGVSLGDLETLEGIKIEGSAEQNNWVLECDQHNVRETFSSGLLGKNGFQLLQVIHKVYLKLEEENPPTKAKIKEGSEIVESIPWYGSAQYLETIEIDYKNQIVKLHFGS